MFPTDLAAACYIINGSVFSPRGDLGELVLGAPQLSLGAGERVFEGGSIPTQGRHALCKVRVLLQQPLQQTGG